MKEKRENLSFFAGIRVLLSFVIILHHYTGLMSQSNRFISILASEGFLAVECFFCIGGFLFARIYYPRITAHQYTLSSFVGARYRRLWPEYVPALLAMTALRYYLNWWKGEANYVTLWAVLENLSLLECGLYKTGDTTFAIVNVAWYLTPLLVCSFLAYIICRAAERLAGGEDAEQKQRRYTIYAFCVLILLGVTIQLSGWSYPLFNSEMARGFMGFFIGGLFGLYQQPEKRNQNRKYRLLAWLGMAVFVYAIIKMNPAMLMITDFVMLPSAALLLGAYPALRAVLSCKAFRVAEKYTYSFYLWHWVVLWGVIAVRSYVMPSLSFDSWGTFAVYFLISAAVSVVSYEIVHRVSR